MLKRFSLKNDTNNYKVSKQQIKRNMKIWSKKLKSLFASIFTVLYNPVCVFVYYIKEYWPKIKIHWYYKEYKNDRIMNVLLNIYNKMYEYFFFICFKNIRMNYNHISILHYLKSWACITPHATWIVFSLYNENALQLMFSLIYYEWEKHLALLPNNDWQLISHYS